MSNGYQVTHPVLDCSYNVILTDDQFHQVCNELAECGEGGKVVRMSDLPFCITFDSLIDEIRNHY
jgi:hypothetical protein